MAASPAILNIDFLRIPEYNDAVRSEIKTAEMADSIYH